MISVVIATYNGSKFIKEQIVSIINQTYSDIEIIVVDDCSTDNTPELARQVFTKNKFKNFKIIINEKNIGVNKTFEKSLNYTLGKYVAFSDQDDIWMESKLETLLNVILENDKHVVGGSSLIISQNKATNKFYSSTRKEYPIFGSLFINSTRGASVLAKREFLVSLLPFPNEEIYDKWIIFNAIAKNEFIKINAPFDYYRVHSNNIVGTKFKRKKPVQILQNVDDKITFYSILKIKLIETGKSAFLQNQITNIDEIIKHLEFIKVLLNNGFSVSNFVKYIKKIFFKKFPFKLKLIYLYYAIRRK